MRPPSFFNQVLLPQLPHHCGKWPKLLIHTFSIIVLNQLILRSRWRSFWVVKGLQSLGLQVLQSSILHHRWLSLLLYLFLQEWYWPWKMSRWTSKLQSSPIHGLLEMESSMHQKRQLIKMGAILIFWKPWTLLGFPTKKVSVIISSSFCHETSNKDCAKLQGEDLSYITRSPTSLGLPFCISPIGWRSFPIKTPVVLT